MAAARCIGVGNLYRRDDGVGLYTAQLLRLEALPGLSIIEQTGEGTALFDAISGASCVILIDAVRSGAEPGTIFEFCTKSHALPTETFGRSSHSFGIAEAVELARSLDQLPESCTVYGIEGACFDWGMGSNSGGGESGAPPRGADHAGAAGRARRSAHCSANRVAAITA